jgi:hypothetical protein
MLPTMVADELVAMTTTTAAYIRRGAVAVAKRGWNCLIWLTGSITNSESQSIPFAVIPRWEFTPLVSWPAIYILSLPIASDSRG